MRFLFACGGTAGHIYPAIAVAGRLRSLIPDCEILFVGAEGKMEMDLVPREGYDIKALKITNLQRQISVRHVISTGVRMHRSFTCTDYSSRCYSVFVFLKLQRAH